MIGERSWRRALTVCVLCWCMVAALALPNCAPTLDYEARRQLACNESCIQAARRRGLDAQTGWPSGPSECGCRFDDGTIDVTCVRGADGECR